MRVLIVSPDIVNGCMAGPGIRYWEMAQALAPYAEVTLAVPGNTSLKDEQVRIVVYDGGGYAIKKELAIADVILVQGFVTRAFPFLYEGSQPIVVDLYDPFLFENLETQRFHPFHRQCAIHNSDLLALLHQLQRGDFFICASERQRDYWLGMLAAVGRIDHEIMERDPPLRSLIDVVPFGLPRYPPRHSRQVLKGVMPGIGLEDRVVIWGGGLWAWLDPLLLIRAFEAIAALHPNARLFFLGTEHPNSKISASNGLSLYREAVGLAKKMGLVGSHVFFNDRWVKYQERQNYLLEADIGVSLHPNSVEMRYAWRTRLLDYVWCGLPMVVSAGDAWSEKVERYRLGRVVPVGDIDALIAALDDMLRDAETKGAYEERFAALRPKLSWDEVIAPLVAFLANPRRASGNRAICQLGKEPARPNDRSLPGVVQ